MTDDRAIVFQRIREALRSPRPHPLSTGVDVEHAPGRFSQWLPRIGPAYADWIAAFRERSELLKTEFITTPRAALADTLDAIARRERWTRAARHRHPLVLEATRSWNGGILETDDGYDPAQLESCEASFTACECLVAQTGSVLGSTTSSGGRALAILPPHHIVIAEKSQLLPDMLSALRHISTTYGDIPPGNLWFETGPSRTGDIERILVLGAHGPKKLTIILAE